MPSDNMALCDKMALDCEKVKNALLKSMEAFYTVYPADGFGDGLAGGLKDGSTSDSALLVARCDYFEHSEKFMVSQKVSLWSADCEEFLYIFQTDFLTEEALFRCMQEVSDDWKTRATIGPGHMCTYVTPIFICNNADDNAKKAIIKCHIYKSFKFSFYGWMEWHTALIECEKNAVFSNKRGKGVKKMVQKIVNAI